MKPSITLASLQTPDGNSLECVSHDQDIFLFLDRQPICSTRAFEPELALARAGCFRISQYRNPKILLAGLGLGHCLHEVLTIAPAKARIDLAEPIKELLDWNRELLGQQNKLALQDERLGIFTQPIASLLKRNTEKLDAIMISADPGLLRAASNTVRICASSLSPKGVLCIKTARDESDRIRGIVRTCNLQSIAIPVAARPGARTRTHAIICAAFKPQYLPPADQ
jgi:spermidine synthase